MFYRCEKNSNSKVINPTRIASTTGTYTVDKDYDLLVAICSTFSSSGTAGGSTTASASITVTGTATTLYDSGSIAGASAYSSGAQRTLVLKDVKQGTQIKAGGTSTGGNRRLTVVDMYS